MAILSIAGVSLPVLIDSFTVGTERVGNNSRGVNGWGMLERRKEKTVYEFALAPRSLDEMTLYRMLLLGEGEFWHAQGTVYGSRGYALSGTGAPNTADTGVNPVGTLTGNGSFKLTTSQTMIVPINFYDQRAFVPSALIGGTTWPQGLGQGGYTLIGWRRDTTAANFRIFAVSGTRKDTAPSTKRERIGSIGASGAPQAYTGGETFSATSTALTITEPGTGGPFYFSNMLVLPWCFSSASLDLLMAGWDLNEQCLPALPRLLVSTDLFPDSQQVAVPELQYKSAMVMVGEMTSGQVQPHWLSGSFTKTAFGLAGRLTEV